MEEETERRAIEYARRHKKEIAAELTSLEAFPPDEAPVSVFMAGSPGAGKTESARNLIEKLTKDGTSILRIDSDDLRERFEEYSGKNSTLFQGATSIIADKMHDIALSQNQNFVFDGTLSNLARAQENIRRSLKRGRTPYIVYVYQDPLQAWRFVQARKEKDGREIPKQIFIEQFFKARENVNRLKRDFGNKLHVDIVVKNIDGSDFKYFGNISRIDGHIPQRYTYKDLERLLEQEP